MTDTAARQSADPDVSGRDEQARTARELAGVELAFVPDALDCYKYGDADGVAIISDEVIVSRLSAISTRGVFVIDTQTCRQISWSQIRCGLSWTVS